MTKNAKTSSKDIRIMTLANGDTITFYWSTNLQRFVTVPE